VTPLSQRHGLDREKAIEGKRQAPFRRAHGPGAPSFADIAIAAIARSRALVLLTRNTRIFEAICDRVIDPFETPPT
jgi:predicted nucleic acid-binding protein